MSFAVDVNILLYASDADSTKHGRAARFLRQCATGPEVFCLAWVTLMGYLRIATHPAIFARPLTPADAMSNVDALLARPNVRVLGEDEGFWRAFCDVAAEILPRGNLVPDTQLAVLLRQHGVDTLYTHDRDFRRFDFLRIVDPLKDS